MGSTTLLKPASTIPRTISVRKEWHVMISRFDRLSLAEDWQYLVLPINPISFAQFQPFARLLPGRVWKGHPGERRRSEGRLG
jgi:hypothetical protein